MKHRPDLLYALAQSLDASCKVVVITEGIGREYLEKQPKLSNLLLMDFQPYHEMPQVLASADVLVATLEPTAGEFAVPSKILSYLCAAGLCCWLPRPTIWPRQSFNEVGEASLPTQAKSMSGPRPRNCSLQTRLFELLWVPVRANTQKQISRFRGWPLPSSKSFSRFAPQ